MVLESATNDTDPFSNPSSPSDNDTYNAPGMYPPPPPIPAMFGFSDAGKQRFINLQLNLAQREFNFHPTAVEREGLSYYHTLFYAAEAKGARMGTLGGLAVAFLMTRRQRYAGFLFRSLGAWTRIPERRQLQLSKATNFLFITGLGRLWGLTSWGVSAFNQVGVKQREDPNMARYLEMRNHWLEQRRSDARAGTSTKSWPSRSEVREMAREYHGEQNEGEADEQSLGGLEYYGEKERMPADDAVATRTSEFEARTRDRAMRERQQQLSSQAETTATRSEDPFFDDDEPESEKVQTQAPPSNWKDRQLQQPRGGSTWDRIRRGEQPSSSSDAPTGDGSTNFDASPWPRRAVMKGFEGSNPEETKGDSFTFSKTDRERAIAKEEAQREFDERVERERQGGGADSFVGEGRRRR